MTNSADPDHLALSESTLFAGHIRVQQDKDCGAVALSASFFPFGVLDGRCKIIVSIPDHCLPLYLNAV